MIDQSLISAKIAALKSNTSGGTYVKIPMLQLTEGKIQVRILPNKFSVDFPFIEKWVYYKFNGETFTSPMTFGDADPIAEFASTIYDKQLKKSITPSYNVIVPVLVRNKELEGIKYWQFSGKVFQQILAYISDPDYGDITDPETGRDIVIEYTPKEKTATGYAETKIMVKPNQTPVLPTKEQYDRLMETQVDILAGERRLSYDDVKTRLENYMSSSQTQKSNNESGVEYNSRFTNNNDNETKTNEYKDKLSTDLDDLFN